KPTISPAASSLDGATIWRRWPPIRRRQNRCSVGSGSPRRRCRAHRRLMRARLMRAPPDRLDRRLLPRPLPAHLASAMLLWLSSRAALTSLPNGWPLSKAEGDRFAALRAEVERLGADSTLAALDRELSRRADGFAAGLAAYHRHPFRRTRA